MLAATQRQESITKVKAWLGIPDLEHKTPADEDNPFDTTEIAKSLHQTTEVNDAQPHELTEIPKSLTKATEDDNTPKRPMTLSEAKKHFRNAQMPKMQLFDCSVDIFQ